MSLDFNTAEEQFDGVTSDFTPIPEGEIVDVLLTIRPGGAGPEGILKQSQRSDAQYLDCEYTVTNGEYERRKFWGNLTLIGGSLNDQGLSKAGIISGRTMCLSGSSKLNRFDARPDLSVPYKQPTGPDGFAKVKATSVSAQTDISSSQKTTDVKSDGGKPSWA